MAEKRKHPKIKSNLHPRNKHRERYDFQKLIASCPELEAYVRPNAYGDQSVEFANPKAVRVLNKALLSHHYGIDNWDIPEAYLCPPIPGRVDYIHYMADFLGGKCFGKIPKGPQLKCLDIGTGSSLIYPLLGHQEYGWSFIATDIDTTAIDSANNILEANPSLQDHIVCRLQKTPKDIFYGVIDKNSQIDLSICNPPFHASRQAAEAASKRKVSNLTGSAVKNPELNFGGKSHELWFEGGEKRFVRNMIRESKKFAENCFLFSTLISKKSNLKGVYEALQGQEATEVKTIPMGQGNKSSRIVVWTFFDKEAQQEWRKKMVTGD